MAGTPGTFRFPEVNAKPPAPPAGYALLYIKTDNVLYLQDSSAVEIALGSSSSITSLIGDVLATGPGTATATVAFVGGKSAAAVATSVTDTQNATSANTFNFIVKRDGSGDIFVTHVNGVLVEAHAARHLPTGADPLTTAAPLVNINASTANGVGSANSLARSDHQHAVDTGTPATQNADQSNAPGTSPNLVRADHIHNIPTAIATDVGAANAQGAAITFSKSDHTHRGVRSVKANSGTQRFGDLSLKNGVGATVTDDGSGNFTIDVTGGASELFVSYSGSGLSVDYTAGKVIFNGTETFVSAGSIAVPASTSNGYVYVNITGAVASAATLPPNTVPMAIFSTGLSSVTFLEDARVFLAQSLVWSLVGDIQTVNATAAKSAGTVEKYARGDHNHDISTGAASTQTPNQANATGTSVNLARADHIHNIPTAAPVTQNTDQSNTDGVAATFSKSDHIHNIPTAVPIQSNADGTNLQGSSANFSKADHKHDILTGTPATQTPDQANAPGSSSAVSRTDHVHNVPTDVPVTQNTDIANTQGTATKFSRADHIHNIPTDVPVQIGTTNIQGASSKFSRADHVHQLTDAITTARLLTGYTVGSNVAILATDSILAAFGKTQGQLNAISGSAITALIGDILATGPGSVTATISTGAVTDTKASLSVKPAVTVVATTNQALTGTPTIDGQATAVNSLILLTAQTTGSQNGPWVAAAGAWSRPTWYPSGGTTQAFQFITTFVRLGTTYGGSVWRQTAAAPITIDTTSTTWVVTPTSGNYKSAFTLGPATGSSDVMLNFANAFIGTLAWNPTASYQIKLPPTQGAVGTFPSNDGAGNLTWTNPIVNIDGGVANSNYTPPQIINGGTA